MSDLVSVLVSSGDLFYEWDLAANGLAWVGEVLVAGDFDESTVSRWRLWAESLGGAVVVQTERPRGETAEQRKARKAAVKEAQRASRAAKKELKAAFKQEAGRQKKMVAGRAAAGGAPVGGSTFTTTRRPR